MSRLHDLPILQNVTNFRELGGHETSDGRRVKRHQLFRSSHWGRASDEDVSVLERYGIGLVIDFRSEEDIALEGSDRLPSGTRHVSVATVDPAVGTDIRTLLKEGKLDEVRREFGNGGAHRYMLRGAEGLVVHRTETFSRFLGTLCEKGLPPALFHCSAGKDRAGWAASLTLLALGVDEASVVEHYLLSNHMFNPGKQSGWQTPIDDEISEMLAPMTGVKPEYVEASISAARREWGSIDAYIRDGLGISDTQRAQLHANWLED
jgi:protein-tyrosine phosphatase